jgi:hypothetical protein
MVCYKRRASTADGRLLYNVDTTGLYQENKLNGSYTVLSAVSVGILAAEYIVAGDSFPFAKCT